MKKLLTKLFVGDYNVKLFGQLINFVRAANFIFPSFLITAIGGIGGLLWLEVLGGIFIIITAALGFFGRRIVKFEVDDYTPAQKFQFVKMGEQIALPIELEKKRVEVRELKEVKDFEELLRTRKFYNILPFSLNFIWVAITLLIIL